jgi:hypothetical protein
VPRKGTPQGGKRSQSLYFTMLMAKKMVGDFRISGTRIPGNEEISCNRRELLEPGPLPPGALKISRPDFLWKEVKDDGRG